MKKNLQLAYKARKVIIGQSQIIKNLDQVKLLIVSSSLSLNSQKQLVKINKNKVPIIYFLEPKPLELASYLPEENIKIIGITDLNFAKLIRKGKNG